MGGWILAFGDVNNFSARANHFGKTFTVTGVPPLHIESKVFGNAHILLWSWSKPPVPDMFATGGVDNKEVLILHGAVTDLGKFNEAGKALPPGERIATLWRKYGETIVPELNGSFSLAVVNLASRTTILFTDRFSSRPVWFSRENKTWYAGNSPAAIAAIRQTRAHIDPAGLWSLFATSRHVGKRGIFYEIQNLQAGQKVVLQNEGSSRMTRWFQLRYTPKKDMRPQEWGEHIAQALHHSAKRLNAVSSELHLFLSGGLDSRIAAGALGNGLRTHTLTNHDNMNARIAKKVAGHLNINHQTIFRTPYWYLDTFEAAALIGGGNYNIQHAHFMIPVQQIRATNSEGAFLLGDLLENFNKHYFRMPVGKDCAFIPEKVPESFHQFYSYTHPNPMRLRRLFRADVVDRLFMSWREAVVETSGSIREVSEDPRDCLDTFIRWSNCSVCPTYLMLECIQALAEERNLMFDNKLLELVLSIPADLRGGGILHRWTLWHLSKGLVLIPNSNFWLPPLFPKSWQNVAKKIRPYLGNTRRKMISVYRQGPIIKTEGSWDMLHERFRRDTPYAQFIESCLFDQEALPSEIFNHEEIKTCWQEFIKSNSPDTFEILMLLSFGLLHKKIPTAGLKI
jgi:hypothetical protein